MLDNARCCRPILLPWPAAHLHEHSTAREVGRAAAVPDLIVDNPVLSVVRLDP